MEQSKRDVDLGRFLSLVLRHQPSADPATAKNVGSRHGKPAVLVVDAAAMVRGGHTFYRSENGVWLCKCVAWCYVREVLYP